MRVFLLFDKRIRTTKNSFHAAKKSEAGGCNDARGGERQRHPHERQVPAPSNAAASQKSSGMAAKEFWTTNVANGNGNVITGTTPINELVNNPLSSGQPCSTRGAPWPVRYSTS